MSARPSTARRRKVGAARWSLLVIVGSAVSLLLGAGPASADNGPHVSTAGTLTARCAGCHRLHSAKAAYLLEEDEPALCYTCHGSGATGASTDVVDGLGYGNAYPSTTRGAAVGALRGGGFQYALIDSANPSGQRSTQSNQTGTVPVLPLGSPAPATSSHSVDGSSVTAWGNGPISATAQAGTTVQLGCTSCHDPHGNGSYRILQPIPTQSGATTGVSIADATTKVYTTTNYWTSWDDNSTGPNSFIRTISLWCTQCHTRYLATAGDGSVASGDAIYTYRHRSDDIAKGTPNCITCHVAHGSNAAMGPYSSALPNPDGTPAAVPDSRLLRIDSRGTCQMCHNR